MVSILRTDTLEQVEKLFKGKNEKKVFTSKSGRIYELGTDYNCPQNPPFTNDTVYVGDFKKKNLIIEYFKHSKDPTRNCIKYFYKFSETKKAALNFHTKMPVESNYGFSYPLSEQFKNIPPTLSDAHKYFDKNLETSSNLSAQCTFQLKFENNKDLDLLEKCLQTVLDETANFFVENPEFYKQLVKGTSYEKKADKELTDVESIKSNFEELTTIKKRKDKDGKEISEKIKYVDVMTVYNMADKEDKMSSVKMAVKTFLYTYDKDSNKYSIHPSWAFNNKVQLIPIFHVPTLSLGKARSFKLKVVLNQACVCDIFSYSSGSVPSKETEDIMMSLMSSIKTFEEEDDTSTKKLSDMIEEEDDEEEDKPKKKEKEKDKKKGKK